MASSSSETSVTIRLLWLTVSLKITRFFRNLQKFKILFQWIFTSVYLEWYFSLMCKRTIAHKAKEETISLSLSSFFFCVSYLKDANIRSISCWCNVYTYLFGHEPVLHVKIWGSLDVYCECVYILWCDSVQLFRYILAIIIESGDGWSVVFWKVDTFLSRDAVPHLSRQYC
jgi:hypothetical protein